MLESAIGVMGIFRGPLFSRVLGDDHGESLFVVPLR